MANVFLSHDWADAPAAEAIAGNLRNTGLDVWLELDHLQRPSLSLEEARKDSAHFVVSLDKSEPPPPDVY